MAWHRGKVLIGGAEVEAELRKDPEISAATITHMPGLAAGGTLEVDGATFVISLINNPGGRDEILELELESEVESSARFRPVKAGRPKTKKARVEALVEALPVMIEQERFRPDDKTHMTEGRPDAGVLTELMGWTVSANESVEAWAELGHDGEG